MIRGCQLANHFGVTLRNVQIIQPSKITLEKFQVMISESRMFQENDGWDDCAGLNAADKTSKPSKSPKIQSLLDEIINDNSSKEQCISQGSSQKTELSQKNK